MGAVLAALMLESSGCGDRGGAPPGGDKPAEPKAPAAAGDGFEVSWFGHLSKTYDGGLSASVDVVKAALRRLGIDVQEEKPETFGMTLEGESRDGTSLVVLLKEFERGKTRITVKVGYLLGDGDAARRIHSEIQSELDLRKSRPGWPSSGAPRVPDAPGWPQPQGAP